MDKNDIIATSDFGRKMLFVSLNKGLQKTFISVDGIEYDLSLFLKFCVSEKWMFSTEFQEAIKQ